MIKAVLAFVAVLGLSSASFISRVYPLSMSQREMAAPMFRSSSSYPTMDNFNARFGVGCGPSSFSCTSPKTIAPSSEVYFSSGYKNIYLTTEAGSSSVSLFRPDGYWVGGADDRGCSAFGGYSGGGDSRVGNMGDVPVFAWACA